jgi:hypothetical protein
MARPDDEELEFCKAFQLGEAVSWLLALRSILTSRVPLLLAPPAPPLRCRSLCDSISSSLGEGRGSTRSMRLRDREDDGGAGDDL